MSRSNCLRQPNPSWMLLIVRDEISLVFLYGVCFATKQSIYRPRSVFLKGVCRHIGPVCGGGVSLSVIGIKKRWVTPRQQTPGQHLHSDQTEEDKAPRGSTGCATSADPVPFCSLAVDYAYSAAVIDGHTHSHSLLPVFSSCTKMKSDS